MLIHMRIRDLGVIEESLVELSEGFSVLTGETGAGKTMIVTGLDLLLGGRADASAVRTGAKTAAIDGVFLVPDGSAAALRAREAGADLDPLPSGLDVELVVTRSVAASGRGRAHVGGRTVPVAVLADLSDDLVAVHGQSEQVLLRSPSRQRELLDAFGGRPVATALAAYTEVFDEVTSTATHLATLTDQARARRQEAELLRVGLAEIEKAAPSPGEDVELRLLSDRLEHAHELSTAVATAHAALMGADDDPDPAPDTLALLEVTRRELDHVGWLDPALAELAGRVGELSHLVVDLGADLAAYTAGIEADPARLAATHERRAELSVLIKRYADGQHARGNGDADRLHSGADGVLAWAERAGQRLLELDEDDDRIEQLTKRLGELEGRLEELSGQLSSARVKAAKRLSRAVTAELAELSMQGSSLEVRVEPRERARHGCDDVSFLLAAHRGAALRPLGKGASGGELSRVMLAIEVATAAVTGPRTLVFDEVDAGVGGRAAVQIGRRLAKLARHAQVVVVTHLPQVAAFADHHLIVEKASDGQVTVSGVRLVDGPARVREIARMLAGLDDSAAAQDHASELLEQAARERV